MRSVVAWAMSIAMTLFAAGCVQNYPDGVGTKLNPGNLPAQTDLQNAYVEEICQQAGLQPTASNGVTSCGSSPYDAGTWWLFVQAGMNDIDQRCDSYLVWLDDAQRSREPVLDELSQLSTTAQTIMRSTGVGANPITIVGAAFGLASGTFTNVYSRMIITMPHSTIQAVVLSRQKEYREQLIGNSTNRPQVAIVNRPAALYALRSYLRLCMPMTIETEINNTIATFERNGADGLEKDSLISAQSAGVPFTPASKPQKPIRAPVASPPPVVVQFFAEKTLSQEEADFTLGGLCIENNKGTELPQRDLIKALIAIYRATPGSPSTTSGDTISRNDRLAINKQSNCGAARNYFEKFTYANTAQPGNNAFNLAAFTDLLKRSQAGRDLSGSPALDSQVLRDKIRAARVELSLTDVPSPMSSHVTPALITALKKLPKPN
ncbi:hypothetical protein [Mesorhizobium loti]|nr:hypothetical protein [Mesorhizobium loti]